MNGRVASSTYSFGVGGQTLFASMIPESVTRSGGNDVALLEVEGDGAGRTLSTVAVEGAAPYRIASRGGSEVILRGADVAATIRGGAVKGFVENVVEDGATLATTGWSATPKAPPSRILVFAGGKLIAYGRPTDPRADVAKAIGKAALRSQFRVSGAAEPGTEAKDLRVFGIRGRAASELPGVTAP